MWIGDLHCASHHLKSLTHFQNYEVCSNELEFERVNVLMFFQIFVKQNPQWETEWIKDREIAMSRSKKRDAESSDSEQKPGKKRSRRHSTERYILIRRGV